MAQVHLHITVLVIKKPDTRMWWIANEAKIDNIERILELEGELSESQQKRLLEIANKCPVHKTLSTQKNIKTYLKEWA